MSTPDEQKGLFSRLPDDREYWRRLTDRIVEDGATRLSDYGNEEPVWWSEIARFSTFLAAGAAAAVLALFVLLPARQTSETQDLTFDAYGLAPSDPLAVTLVAEGTPPTIETLIAVRNAEYPR